MPKNKKSSKKTNITIFIPTIKDCETAANNAKRIQNTLDNPCRISIINNGEGLGLTKVYNMALTNKIDDSKDEIIVFIHDDIEFLKKGWDSELIRMFNEHKDYGIIGVAGSAEFDEGGAWWNYEHKYGQVMHRHEGKQWLSNFSDILDHDLEEVCVIDGLFIAVHRKRISKLFDEDIQGFNFYDIDFCLANYIDGQCKIGVTSNIRLCHNSIGALKQEWYDNLKQVNEKYKEYYPIKVKKHAKR